MLKTDRLPELSQLDVFKSPCFVFDMHSREKKDLITRYRGTVCRRLSTGFEIISWQKSMYRFGGLYREVPIAVRAELDESARIVSLTIDEESCGSQGKSCDFACLERSLRDKLINRPFTEFSQIYKDAGTTGCLHVFEILSGASAFFAVLRDSGSNDGAEQELVKISPDAGGLSAENIHEVLGKTSVTKIDLRHNALPTFGKKGLPESMDAHLSVSVNGRPVSESDIKADDFPGCYSQLNRAYTRAYHAEKKFFGLSGKQRWTKEICFFRSERVVQRTEGVAKKLERWNRISEEAAKQSGRGIIPEVRWIDSFVEALDAAKRQEDAFFLYETGERESLRAALKGAEKLGSAAVITGPEGGFEPYEADMARKVGLHICSMGARILRCETAPVVALTALMYESGNLE